jgi:Trp operon repressor
MQSELGQTILSKYRMSRISDLRRVNDLKKIARNEEEFKNFIRCLLTVYRWETTDAVKYLKKEMEDIAIGCTKIFQLLKEELTERNLFKLSELCGLYFDYCDTACVNTYSFDNYSCSESISSIINNKIPLDTQIQSTKFKNILKVLISQTATSTLLGLQNPIYKEPDVLKVLVKSDYTLNDFILSDINDKSLLISTLLVDRDRIAYIPKQYLSDVDILIAACKAKVGQFSSILKAIPEVKTDRKLCKIFLRYCPYGCENSEFKDDIGLTITFVQHHRDAFRKLNKNLASTRTIQLAAVRAYASAFLHIPEEYADIELAMQALQTDIRCYPTMPGSIRSNKEIALKVLERVPGFLECCTSELQADREVVLTAVTRDSRVLKFASNELQKELDYLKLQIKKSVVMKEQETDHGVSENDGSIAATDTTTTADTTSRCIIS